MIHSDTATIFLDDIADVERKITELRAVLPSASGDPEAISIINDLLHVYHSLQSGLHKATATLTQPNSVLPIEPSMSAHTSR